jgi:hypothetical protein
VTYRWARTGVVTIVTIRQELGAPALDLVELARWLRDATVAAIVDEAPWPIEAAACVVIPEGHDVLDVHEWMEHAPPAFRAVHWGPDDDRLTTLVTVPTLVTFPPDAAGPLRDEAQLYAHEAVCGLEPDPAWQADWRTTSVPIADADLEPIITASHEWVLSDGFIDRFGEPWTALG